MVNGIKVMTDSRRVFDSEVALFFFFNGLRVSFVNVTYSLEPLKRLGRLLPGLPGLLRLENFTFFRKLQPPDEHGERRSRVTSLSETGMEEAWNRRQARIQSQSSCLSI